MGMLLEQMLSSGGAAWSKPWWLFLLEVMVEVSLPSLPLRLRDKHEAAP